MAGRQDAKVPKQLGESERRMLLAFLALAMNTPA